MSLPDGVCAFFFDVPCPQAGAQCQAATPIPYLQEVDSPPTMFGQEGLALKSHVSAEKSVMSVNDLAPNYEKHISSTQTTAKRSLSVIGCSESPTEHR